MTHIQTAAQTEFWWEFYGAGRTAEYGWGTEAEAQAYAEWRTARARSQGQTGAVQASRIDEPDVLMSLNDNSEWSDGFNLHDELAENRCAWGTCTGQALEVVRYPDGTELACCAECADVARDEVKHLEESR